MTVGFNSCRPLGRAENITAVWEAFDGDKEFHGGAKGMGGFVNVGRWPENVIVTDEFVFDKRPEQIVVMIAHGLTGGKKYGRDQARGIFKRSPDGCERTNYYIVSSEYGRQFAASAAGIPLGRCLPLGMPRTDRYIGAVKGEGKTPLRGYTSYLYAPTFRARYDPPREPIDWERIDSILRDDELMVVKRHMNSPCEIVGKRLDHVIEVPAIKPSAGYIIDCDVLVTDFSSIMFDAMMLRKPVVLVSDSNDSYLETRGMYMPYPDGYSSRWILPSGNEEAFVEMLREAAANGQREADLLCLERVAGACDGHSAERVAEFVSQL